MLRSLTTAASGMQAQQTQLDVTANNIANVSTPGFKKSRVDFENLMVETVRAAGSGEAETPSPLEVGMGVRISGTERSHLQGSLQSTGNPLDLAIEGAGFFQVVLPTGDTGYTRAGSFQKDAEGRIVTHQGMPLLGDIEIPPDAETVTIGADGVIQVAIPGQPEPVEVGRIELATFANPSGLSAMDHNLFRETGASGSAVTGAPGQNGTGALSQGTLEMSNVRIVEEMIDLISGQRAYEVNARVIRAADEMLQQASNLR
jgi:flagellar basal-body rod protein FlgG